ncbi:MAG TPA: hypothetical protein DCG75_07695 [Bacteroidales bacterium]|jgi:hypothetical protein|nr:hypothetical protein [Bacteroidales bacterium]
MLFDHDDFAFESDLNQFIFQAINDEQKHQFRNSSNKFIHLVISNILNIKQKHLSLNFCFNFSLPKILDNK